MKELYFDRPSAPLEIKPRMLDAQVVHETMLRGCETHVVSQRRPLHHSNAARTQQRTHRFSCCAVSGSASRGKTKHHSERPAVV